MAMAEFLPILLLLPRSATAYHICFSQTTITSLGYGRLASTGTMGVNQLHARIYIHNSLL
jgi:hypothetical protein